MKSSNSFSTLIISIVNVALMSLWDLTRFTIWPNIHRCGNKYISDITVASTYLLLDRKYKVTQCNTYQQLWHWEFNANFLLSKKKQRYPFWLKLVSLSLTSEITQEGTLQLKQLKFGNLISKWKLACYNGNYWATL